ncbi:MAG: N-acetylglucosamine kinase [Flavobacteriaceae bacterium]|nr:N-acetylglucosamine kinase [Flavobacteriaceae bacterium]
MILIVDSGATKADWICINKNSDILFSTQTLGLNPHYLSSLIINERIVNNFEIYQNRNKISHLYFYGAGCGVDSSVIRMKKAFEKIFANARFTIKEDTYAAVYSVVDFNGPSIVCILGTGSNCTYFDGKDIEQRITSLGYLLMDQASGNYFGKELLRAYYFNQMPEELSQEFSKQFDLDPNVVKENIYRKDNPPGYLASFAKFLVQNRSVKTINEILNRGFQIFIENQIFQYPNAKDVPIHFVGSIAFYLKEELKKTLKDNGLKIGKVIKQPIDGLVSYHKKINKS